MAQVPDVEVDQQANRSAAQSQVRQQLCLMIAECGVYTHRGADYFTSKVIDIHACDFTPSPSPQRHVSAILCVSLADLRERENQHRSVGINTAPF